MNDQGDEPKVTLGVKRQEVSDQDPRPVCLEDLRNGIKGRKRDIRNDQELEGSAIKGAGRLVAAIEAKIEAGQRDEKGDRESGQAVDEDQGRGKPSESAHFRDIDCDVDQDHAQNADALDKGQLIDKELTRLSALHEIAP